jgi:hypothetical protein
LRSTLTDRGGVRASRERRHVGVDAQGLARHARLQLEHATIAVWPRRFTSVDRVTSVVRNSIGPMCICAAARTRSPRDVAAVDDLGIARTRWCQSWRSEIDSEP